MASTLRMLASVLFLSETGWLWTGVKPLIYCTLAQLKGLLGLQARAVPRGIEHQSTFALLTLSGKQGGLLIQIGVVGNMQSWKFLVH